MYQPLFYSENGECQQITHPHTHQAPQHLIPDYNVEDLLLNDRWQYANNSRHQAMSIVVTGAKRYVSMSGHTAVHQPEVRVPKTAKGTEAMYIPPM